MLTSHQMSLQSIKLYNQLAKKKLFQQKVNFNLQRIKTVLNLLKNPEKKLSNVVNIIGSDGKFSLLNSLKSFLEADGKKVSAFISPSLKDLRERFWMGDKFLSYKDINNSIREIENLKIPLTIFELFTVIYILNASKKYNDYHLIEAGALFAKDSTNVFHFPKLQVVVNINKQHLNFVKKKTIDEIIHQKVSFLSNYTKIYIGKQNKKNLLKIRKKLKKNKSEKIYSEKWKILSKNDKCYYKDKKCKILIKTSFIHSNGLLNNLGMAIKIALDLGIKRNIIEKTIPKIKFSGRVDFITKGKIISKLKKNEKLIIDGCHSEVSGKNFANFLKKIKVTKYGIWGMSTNKDPVKFIKSFDGVFEKIYTVNIENNKSLSPEKLKVVAKKENNQSETAKNILDAIKKISTPEKKLICVFGSLYLCGNFLEKN